METDQAIAEDWCPSASLANIRLRAVLIARLRAFFAERKVLEVETPLLSTAATPDPQLASFTTRYQGPGAPDGQTLYLHTSPEFPMKRLLAAGTGPIYQITKVFRNGEAGRLHNPEFTMLEWYRPGFDHHQLMTEVEELVTAVLDGCVSLAQAERLAYRDAFARYTGIDPLTADSATLARCAETHGLRSPPLGEDLDAWRDLLLTHLIEPHLGRGRLSFVYDYPASQAALARLCPDKPTCAERFELYLEGVELANGFHELADAHAQRQRFEAELTRRGMRGLPPVPLDERLLSALVHGLPSCAGVALGIDRLIMLAAGTRHLADVISFTLDRA